MPLTIKGRSDSYLESVMKALAGYEADHPHAEIVGYRQNLVSIRVRIVDRDFAGRSKSERHEDVWRYLDQLPEDIQSQLSVLLLLSPDEAGTSFANMEFDSPIPSRI